MRMNFCPECGRQRSTSTQYCGGCGRDFGVTATGGNAELSALPDVEPSRWDADTEESPPTMTIGLGDPVVVSPTAAPGPAGPSYSSPEGRPGRGRGLWIAVTAIVLLAAGGGSYALISATGNRQTALPQGHTPTVASNATVPPTHPADTQPASLQASTSPSASASPSRSASPSASPSVVSVSPGLKSASAQVEIVLSHYFQGINKHSYAEYASSQTAQGKADQPESSFNSGYATTADSGMTLTSLTPTGQDLTATVTFTSRQSPADSVDNSPCDTWTLKLYLVPNGTGYLITPAPSDYEPSHTDC
jgi:hypothetical protein